MYVVCVYCTYAIENIAKSEQSSHTPAVAIRGHFSWKENWIKGLISNMWLNFLYTVQLLISDVGFFSSNTLSCPHRLYKI